MRPAQIVKLWPIVTGTAVVVSAVWAFFLTRELSVRDERIKLLQESQGKTDVSGFIRKIDKNMAKLSLATSIDPIDARVSLGSMVKSPTDVTNLLVEIGGMVKEKKFDLIEPKLGEIERLYPEFPGSIVVRFEVAQARGYVDEAEKFAEQLTAILPTDKRVASAHLFIAERCLSRKEPAKAEKRVLAAIALDPSNEDLRKKFEAIFGYRPSLK